MSKTDDDFGHDALAALQAGHRAAKPPAWSVTEGEYLSYHMARSLSLEQVIADALEDWTPGPESWDRAVWQGPRCLAVIKAMPDGSPKVVRLDLVC